MNKYEKLRKINLWMAAAHGIQAALLLLLSSDFAASITTQYLVFDSASEALVSASRTVAEFPFVYGVAGFSLISATFHLMIATVFFNKYKKYLKKGMNPYRWIEYSLSASLMIVLIALLSGIFDLSSLIMMFGLTAIMNLMGLMMEVHNQTTKKTNWLSYWIGCLAGILPWVVIGVYFWGSATAANPGEGIPAFVYFIWVSIFMFFNSFAVNMYLQYKKMGKWSDYLYGERVYIWLSLFAKSALVWQIYAGTLQP